MDLNKIREAYRAARKEFYTVKNDGTWTSDQIHASVSARYGRMVKGLSALANLGYRQCFYCNCKGCWRCEKGIVRILK